MTVTLSSGSSQGCALHTSIQTPTPTPVAITWEAPKLSCQLEGPESMGQCIYCNLAQSFGVANTSGAFISCHNSTIAPQDQLAPFTALPQSGWCVYTLDRHRHYRLVGARPGGGWGWDPTGAWQRHFREWRLEPVAWCCRFDAFLNAGQLPWQANSRG